MNDSGWLTARPGERSAAGGEVHADRGDPAGDGKRVGVGLPAAAPPGLELY